MLLWKRKKRNFDHKHYLKIRKELSKLVNNLLTEAADSTNTESIIVTKNNSDKKWNKTK